MYGLSSIHHLLLEVHLLNKYWLSLRESLGAITGDNMREKGATLRSLSATDVCPFPLPFPHFLQTLVSSCASHVKDPIADRFYLIGLSSFRRALS